MADEGSSSGAETAAWDMARIGIIYTGLGDSTATVGPIAPIVSVAAIVMGIEATIRSIAFA